MKRERGNGSGSAGTTQAPDERAPKVATSAQPVRQL